MQHITLSGKHYEIGFSYGFILRQDNTFLLSRVPYQITEKRMAFSNECLPIYQKFFPEILEEIKGIAEGQNCSAEVLQAVLFTMYAMPPASNCSCFAVSTNEVLLGRNSDFLTSLEQFNTNAIYYFSSEAYSFTGNTTAFVEMEDGVNEHGLAAGLTAVYPIHIKPGLNAGMLLRLILEKCRTVNEAISLIEQIPISSSQTLILTDRLGDIALIESCSEHIEIIRPHTQFICATNSFHSEIMSAYNLPNIDNWETERRYCTLTNALDKEAGVIGVQGAMNLLSGKKGFLCQYNRASGKDTVWSVIYDLKNLKIYLAEGNPQRVAFQSDGRFFQQVKL